MAVFSWSGIEWYCDGRGGTKICPRRYYFMSEVVLCHVFIQLPITNIGNVHHVELKSDNKIIINTYDLNNYFEKRGALPEDIQMKSYFDLTSAILSSVRSEKSNWVICEGSDDKFYLTHYLDDMSNIRFLSVGGCGNVIKLYKYLYTPFIEKEEKKAVESKVLCLIDTDDIVQTLDISSDVRGKLKLARIQPERDETVKLQAVKKGYHNPTEMEDCLNPRKYYEAVKEEIIKAGDTNLISIFNKFEFNDGTILSRINNEEFSILKPKELVDFKDKRLIYDFLDDHHNKFLIEKNYTSKEKNEIPPLFRVIKEYFSEN